MSAVSGFRPHVYESRRSAESSPFVRESENFSDFVGTQYWRSTG
jgi:hypothetical protein